VSEPSARHVWAAIALAALAHGALLFAFYQPRGEFGARERGVGGIEIDLGRMGSAPGTRAVAPSAPSQASAATAQPVQAAPLSAEAAPVEVAKADVPAEAAIPEAVTPEPTESDAPPPEDVEETAPQAVETTEVEQTEPTTEPVQPAPVQPEPVEAAAAPSVQAVAQAPSAAGAEGTSGTGERGETGSGAAEAAGGRRAAQVSYLAKLKSWLDRHKVYPEDARNRRVEGTVRLYFVIGADGRVLDYSIRESSGHAALDRAAEELIERAQPLPQLPDAFGRDQLPIVAPIQFNLR